MAGVLGGLHSTARTNAGPWYIGRNGKHGIKMEGDPRRENSFNKEAKTRLRAEMRGIRWRQASARVETNNGQ